MDNLTTERITLMHPAARKMLLEQYAHANNKLLPEGVRLRFTHTYRSIAEQNKLFNQKPKITNAKGGQSIHQYGLAFDIVLLFDKEGNGKFQTASWEKDNFWICVTNYFKSQGWVCGGDWKTFKDAPHFEMTFGHTWKTLKAKVDKGEIIKEVINGIEYQYPNI